MRCALRTLVLAALTLAACREGAPAPSAGAPPLPVAPSPVAAARTGPEEAGGVRFLERTTGGADARAELPLIVAIHGFGDRPEAFVDLFDGFTGEARLIVPYGLEPQGDGFSWFPLSLGDEAVLARGTEAAAGKLAAMIAAVGQTRATRGRAIVTGFSQGGMLSFALAALHPASIDVALPVSGTLAAPLRRAAWPVGQALPAVHALHGDADTRVPVDGSRASVAALRQLGFDADLTEHPGVGHTISAAMRRDLYTRLDAALRR